MATSEQSAWFLRYIDQVLSSDFSQALFLVDTVLMLIGVGTVAVLGWKYLQAKFSHKILLEAAICFIGIGLSGTAYETYHIVRIVHKNPDLSQKIETLSNKIEETSQTVEDLSRTTQEIAQKLNDLNCPPQKIAKTACWQKTCRSDCASKASITVPPSQSEANPVSPANSTSLLSHPAESARQADGWVYVGTGSGLEWDEKYFNWDGEEDRLPETGDTLTATGSVHLRMPLGCQAPIVGAIVPGERVHVLRAQTVADCHHWVQVKRM